MEIEKRWRIDGSKMATVAPLYRIESIVLDKVSNLKQYRHGTNFIILQDCKKSEMTTGP